MQQASEICSTAPTAKIPKLVLLRWTLPRQGEFKINFYGFSKDQNSWGAGGSILRDGTGNNIIAVGEYLESGTAIEVEINSISIMLQWCI